MRALEQLIRDFRLLHGGAADDQPAVTDEVAFVAALDGQQGDPVVAVVVSSSAMDVRMCSTVGVPLPRSERRAQNSAASASAHGRSISRSVSRWNGIASYVLMPPLCLTDHHDLQLEY